MTVAAFVPAWNTGTYAHGGLVASTYMSRPIGCTVVLTYKPIGAAHDISVSILPTEPMVLSSLPAAPTNWPVDVRVPLTTGQAVAGARTFTMTSGDEVSLNMLPVDPLSVTFEVASVARSLEIAWTGAAVWVYGLADGDLLQAHIIYTEEYYTSGTHSTAVSAGQMTLNPPNTNYLDRALTTVEKYVGMGFSIYKAIGGLAPFAAQRLAIRDRADLLGMTFACNPVGFLNNISRRPSTMAKPLCDESKEEETEFKELMDRSSVLIKAADAAMGSVSSSSSSSSAGLRVRTPRV